MEVRQQPFLAMGLRLLSSAGFSTMMVFVKLSGTSGVRLPEILFWRQFLPMVVLLLWLAGTGRLHRLRTHRPGLHARRALIGTSNMFLALGVVQLMPLAEASVLGFTTPIFAVILAVVLLGERVGRWRMSALLLGLGGVTIIAGPDGGHISALGLAIGLGAAFGTAVISIQLRQMAATEEPITIVFWFSAAGAALLLPLMLAFITPHSLWQWTLLLGCGAAGLAGQMFATASLRFGSVSSVMVMDYSQLAWATLWGWTVFGQLPPAATWIGGPMIVGAGLIIAWREQLLHRRPVLDPLAAPNSD